jgi:hypothetical protein
MICDCSYHFTIFTIRRFVHHSTGLRRWCLGEVHPQLAEVHTFSGNASKLGSSVSVPQHALRPAQTAWSSFGTRIESMCYRVIPP